MSVGGGDTKKIAKHTSAQKLINKFFQPTGWDAEEDDDRSLHSNGQNSVSNLMDLCVQKGYHKPTFKELTSYGPSHAPTFEIECQLNSVKQSAEAGNKQQAKAMAAQKVLDILLSVSTIKILGSMQALCINIISTVFHTLHLYFILIQKLIKKLQLISSSTVFKTRSKSLS